MESTGMAVRLVLFDGCFEFQPGKQLQKLRKNAAYSIHGGSLRSLSLVLVTELKLKVSELSPFFFKANWDTPGARPTQLFHGPKGSDCDYLSEEPWYLLWKANDSGKVE